ncbi:hypothetical protein EKG83_43175 [Saccharothrix syringae]|uniref:Uncharacterized protein n=1 Tax=Saccharothrix syringae TaxID=103733 RepID=A0A5Q0HCG2_SACSY|nr:hypothetical protein EKG83_43175 [Saccharothrix syringae]
MSPTPLAERIQARNEGFTALLTRVGGAPVVVSSFNNEPTWDNATGNGGFDNRPTWDNWKNK